MNDENEALKKEMIKKVDKRKLKKLIAMCFNIKDCEVLGLDNLLNEWANKKVELYKLFNKELKLVREIDITREQIQEIEKNSGTNENDLKGYWDALFSKMLQEIYDLTPIIHSSIDRNFRFSTLRKEMPDITAESMQYYGDRYFKNRNEKMNFSTLMHKIYRSDDIDKIVSKYLQNINSNIKGKMYVSIDPFDYVTMSLNKSGWSSCHSLHKERDGVYVGEYSAGLFSYMCDDVSAIAYRTDGEQYKYEFNKRSIMAESKAWRQMVFINKDLSYFIPSRQYPFRSEILTKIIREMVEEVICKDVREVAEEKDETETNKWKVSRRCGENKRFVYDVNDDNEDYFDDDDYDEDEYENDAIGFDNLHYNDILNGFNYEFVYQNKYKKSDLRGIVIGSNPCCPVCGINKLRRSDEPMCRDCQNKYDLDF